ncbi:hypothetical protein D3C72_1270680 [compost metagenome]
MIRLMAAKNVINKIGRHRDLTAGLFLAGMTAFDQPGNDGAVAEGALQHEGFVQPCFQIVAEHVLVQQVGQ